MSNRICQNCGAQVPDEAGFCISCGKKISAQFCQACGTQIPDGARFCPSCGKEVILPPRIEVPSINKGNTGLARNAGNKTKKGKIIRQTGKKPINPIVANLMGVVGLVLVCLVGLYFWDSFASIPFSHPFYTSASRTTLLTNPNFTGKTTKVSPKELQQIVDKYSYAHKYEVGVYDCSDMSVALAKYLEEKGYDTSVIGDDNNVHAWVYIWTDKNKALAIETTTNVLGFEKMGGGEIIGDEAWDVMYQFPSIGDTLKSLIQYRTAYEFYYPIKNRSGLHVLEWNEVEEGR
jgi:RNA polymerase subunit RPABC4/transcription elongation factor Spt4